MQWKFSQFKRKHYIIGGVLIVVILSVVLRAIFASGADQVATVKVIKGTIVQEVTATGKTKPVESVDLGFERLGRVARVYVKVGDEVRAGQLLAQLDAGDVAAQYRQQLASWRSAEANLQTVKNGARPEDLAIQQNEVLRAEQNLSGAEANLRLALKSAFTTADDVVRVKMASLFSGNFSAGYYLTYATSDFQAKIDVEWQRQKVERELLAWQQELTTVEVATETELIAAVQNSVAHLVAVRAFLDRVNDTLNTGSVGVLTDLYRPTVNAARSTILTASTSLESAKQAVATQKVYLAQAEEQLNLKQAGSTAEQIAAQTAVVESVAAAAQAIGAQLSKYSIVAPFAGLVTRQDAKVGAIMGGGQSLLSLISYNKLEIEANISEVDIGKVKIGDPVTIELDAIPGEKFSGEISYINPAETVVDGVVNYKIKVLFAKFDNRFKSGLTANLTIETLRHTDVLFLPQAAVMEQDGQILVKKLVAGQEIVVPVELGIRDQNGQVEITSSTLAVDDDVVNIGVKASN